MSLWKMSPGQLKRYATDDVERMEDDENLSEWLSDVASDLARVQVGVFRCVSGEVLCPDEECDDDCECCEHDELWESPLVEGWNPRCADCDRPALLVRAEERERDYSAAVA